MPVAMKCSRCGTYYDDYSTKCTVRSDKKWPYNAVLTIDIDTERDFYQREITDLCPNCKKSFEHWKYKYAREQL